MKNLKDRVKEKQWKKEHIKSALKVLHEAEQAKTAATEAYEHMTYFVAIFCFFLCNIVVSCIVLLFLVMTTFPFTLFVTLLLGMSFGVLYYYLLYDFHFITKHHHFIPGIVVPLLSSGFLYFVLMYVMPTFFSFHISEVLLSVVYGLSFIIPFLYFHYVKKDIVKLHIS